MASRSHAPKRQGAASSMTRPLAVHQALPVGATRSRRCGTPPPPPTWMDVALGLGVARCFSFVQCEWGGVYVDGWVVWVWARWQAFCPACHDGNRGLQQVKGAGETKGGGGSSPSWSWQGLTA